MAERLRERTNGSPPEGKPIPLPFRARMEAAFGMDLGHVQARVGDPTSLDALGATAATEGDVVTFDSTTPSVETVAHELTHVVQQGGASAGGVSRASDPSEREAEEVAGRVAAGEAAGPVEESAAPGRVHREDKGRDPAELEKIAKEKEAFEKRAFALKDHIPSTGLGKFDAAWNPGSGDLDITVRIAFEFTQADDAPGLLGQIGAWFTGEDISRFFWQDAEKQTWIDTFTQRVQDRWSDQHRIDSVKPDWEEYLANAKVHVVSVGEADAASAHYKLTIHKSSGDNGIEYKSGIHNEHLTDPTQQPTGDLWQSDVQENPDFSSGTVATQERERIEAELAATTASPVQFEQGSDTLSNDARTGLRMFATALREANPSAPLVPLGVTGFASPEGDATRNADLSRRRADVVKSFLEGQGVRQPVSASSGGTTGPASDPAGRKAEIRVDRTFETTYAGNRYSVAEHEFGHLLGMPDEYSNATGGPLGTAQANYQTLLTSAGLSQTSFGTDTSSQMSNGVDVLPSHYVTMWEALGQMTRPDIQPNQWVIG